MLYFFRIQSYIDNGWDKSRLKDPDCGVHTYELMKENISEKELEIMKILDNPPQKSDPRWTQSLTGIPVEKVSHSGVEQYFSKSIEKRHMREGYSLSKTLKFETSGRSIRLNLFDEKYFLLEGYTRPSMKSAKGISHGSGIYRCIIVY